MQETNTWSALLLLLLLLPSAAAFQVSPAAHRTLLEDAAPYELRLINDEGEALNITIKAGENVTVRPATVALGPEERETRVTVDPRGARPKPGKTSVPVVVTMTGRATGQFGGSVALQHTLVLVNPYDGAYVEGALTITDGLAVLALENLGERNTTVYADLEGPNETLSLGSRLLAGKSQGKLERPLNWSLAPGGYDATAVLSYDDNGTVTRRASTSFAVGEPYVSLELPGATFTTGQIIEVPVRARLDWNRPIDARLHVTLQRGGERVSTITATKTLSPRGETEYPAFLELAGVAAGNATLRIEVSGEGERLGSATLDVRLLPPPPEGERGFSLLLAGLALLLLLGILLTILRWRNKNFK